MLLEILVATAHSRFCLFWFVFYHFCGKEVQICLIRLRAHLGDIIVGWVVWSSASFPCFGLHFCMCASVDNCACHHEVVLESSNDLKIMQMEILNVTVMMYLGNP
jgi:hypothetical protein